METITFPDLISVKAIEPYILWVEYSDGTSGKVDLSHLAGRGVFEYWNQIDNFNKVRIGKETGALEWNDEIDICPDSVYLDLKQKTFEDYAQDK
jgi:hypothetical protein